MPSRYTRRGNIEVSKGDMFKQIKQRRDLDSVSLFLSPRFKRIAEIDLEELSYEGYIWTRGDNFYKLAHEFYGVPEYWWVVALFNNAPTEQHIKIGQRIFIPHEPESIISLMGV